MKKIVTLIMSVIFVFGLFAFSACEKNNDAKIKIICTIFPEYDWAREITGDVEDISIKYLLDSGVDLHSFQPSVQDVVDISTCDLFIYVGGESDSWVENALKNAKNEKRKVIKLLDVLGDKIKEEEIVEGMQGEEEPEEEREYDEHVWLSFKNAVIVCEKIADTLKSIDGKNGDKYLQNLSVYIEKLNALDKLYKETVENGTKSTLLFGDRFPFRYLAEDYGLNYYAAFVGCSAESEASFETIKFLSEKVDELNLPVILTIEGDNHGIAKTIRDNTILKNQEILVMDSMQSVTKSGLKNGVTYLSVMEDNLISLSKALK